MLTQTKAPIFQGKGFKLSGALLKPFPVEGQTDQNRSKTEQDGQNLSRLQTIELPSGKRMFE